jgi:hypothetical protein
MITRNRLHFEGHFTQVPNAWVRDRRISRRARGLLTEIMSYSVGWKLTVETLQESGPEGRDALRAALAELEDAGYLTRTKIREGGKYSGTDYVLSDPFEQSPAPENPTLITSTESPSPAPEKPAPDNPQLRIPFKEHSLSSRESTRRRPARPLPEGFAPNDAHIAYSKEKSLDLKREFENFLLHVQATDRRQADWNAAFRMWLGKARPVVGSRQASVDTHEAIRRMYGRTPREESYLQESML